MGGHPYFYFVPFQKDVNRALQELREREFKAGRYNPVVPFPEFPLPPDAPAPGAQHASIDEALEDADADGTRSILDLFAVADEPDYGVVAPIEPELLEDLYGTTQPTRDILIDLDFLEELERGQGVYTIVYENGEPTEIMFAGYSFD